MNFSFVIFLKSFPQRFKSRNDHTSFNSGARGRIRTCTGDLLKVVSLLLDYASCWRRATWILQPVLPRQEFFTKEIRRLLRGGKDGRSLRCCPGQKGT